MHLKLPFRQAVLGGRQSLNFKSDTGAEHIEVNIPPGVDHGQRLRIAGKGGTSPVGGARGDLFLDIEVEPDALFSRQGHDLLVTVTVPFSGACLGTSVEVPTLTGSKRVKVPHGMAGGGKLRLKGYGVPGHGKKNAGDLYAIIEIAVPKKLTEEQRVLLEQLQAAGL